MPELDFVLYFFGGFLFQSLLYIATIEIVVKHASYHVRPLLKRLQLASL